MDKKLPTIADLGVSLSNFEDKAPSLLLDNYAGRKKIDQLVNNMASVDSLGPKALAKFDW